MTWVSEGEAQRLRANEKRLMALASLFEVPVEHLGTVMGRMLKLVAENAKLHRDNQALSAALLKEDESSFHAAPEVQGVPV